MTSKLLPDTPPVEPEPAATAAERAADAGALQHIVTTRRRIAADVTTR